MVPLPPQVAKSLMTIASYHIDQTGIYVITRKIHDIKSSNRVISSHFLLFLICMLHAHVSFGMCIDH